MVSLLRLLHRADHFVSCEDWETFDKRLQALLRLGILEKIPAQMSHGGAFPEVWIRDRVMREVFCLVEPDFPALGLWEKIKDPGQRPFFRALWPHETLDQEEYAALRARLDDAVSRGEVERALKIETLNPGAALYHHPATEEVFELLPPQGE